MSENGTERSVPERPPCEEVDHMSDTTDGNHVDLERRVCPNCRLYFDTGADSGQVFCGTACMLDYDGAELRADGGSRWTLDLSGLRRSSDDSEEETEEEGEEREKVPLSGPAWYVATPSTMPDLVFPEDDYCGAFQWATGQRIDAASEDEVQTGEDCIRLVDFDDETEVPIADV